MTDTFAALREIVRHRSFADICNPRAEENRKILVAHAENGYLSQHDLTETAKFMGVCGQLPLLPLLNGVALGLVAAAVSTRFRIPKSLVARSSLVASVTAATYVTTSTEDASVRRRDFVFDEFWKRLENPPGVLQALQVVTNRYADFFDAPAPSPLPAPEQSPLAQSTSTSASQPQSRWDDIRNKNAKQATPSAWDALREKHERSQVQSREPTSTRTTDVPVAQDDRSRAQAEFDAILERERNMK